MKEFDGTLVNDSVVLVDRTEHGLSGVDAARFEDTVAECATAFCKRLTDDYQPIKVLAYSDTRTACRLFLRSTLLHFTSLWQGPGSAAI